MLGPQRFDQQVSAATSRIQLGATNTVEVVVNSDGGTLRLEVVDEGQTCSILRPVDVLATGLQTNVSSANAFPLPELQLFNGGLDGSAPTNKGEVTFNGALLVSRMEIREKVTAVLNPLTLAPSNTLSARAGENGLFSVQVVDRDETPPLFTIGVPADGSFTNKAQLAVSGTIDDPSATVAVDGAAASVAGSRYTGQANLAECWNTITVQAGDGCTNASGATARVGLDTVPPVLGLMGPPNGLVTNQRVLPVLLRYSDDFSGVDPSSVRLALDGTDLTGLLSIGTDMATGSLTLTEGSYTLHAQVSDRAGNVAFQDSSFIVDLTPPVLAIVAPADGSTSNPSAVTVTITYTDANSGVDLPTFAVSLDGQDVTKSLAAGPVSASSTLSLAPGTHQLDVQISDLAANVARAHSSFTVVNLGSGLPPDPATVAPPSDLTVATDIAASTAFLYTGSNPIQTGVAPGTIEPLRVAVIRGQVRGRDGTPIGGVNITVLGHPELGKTLTRADGLFDLAVNGGGQLTVSYQKDGYLPAQRQVRSPWRDYVRADDVVLVSFDTDVTPVALGASSAQVARGSPVNDTDGSRQATLIFPAGTTASMVLPDGTTQSLASLHVRATEYTVGPTGPKAMPAALPPTSAYTYAVELSVDEAVMAGATTVQFNQPVAFYVENFLGFQVGGTVPVGYYDRTRGVWVPSDDGRVVKIVGVTGGLAELDTNGDGVADDAATLSAAGVTVEEQAALATLYVSGTSLWRVQMTHFSPWDCNWPYGCEGGPASCPPPTPPPPPPPPPDDPCKQSGSIIECETQVLGERTSITGTSLALRYSSRRTRGYAVERRVVIPLVGATYASGLDSVSLTVDVAGQHHSLTFPPSPNLRYSFEWDGKDRYGRDVIGAAEATIGISYDSRRDSRPAA